MRLLLDRHREFPQSVRHLVKMRISEHTSELASESSFVILSCKESDRFPTTSGSTCAVSSEQPVTGHKTVAHPFSRSGGHNLR